MPLQIINGPVIAAGESLSAPLDVTAGNIVRITMPGAWTGMLISFQISTDGVFFNDYYNGRGQELVMAVVPGVAVAIISELAHPVAHLKIRSGTRDEPVVQPEQREFALAVEVPEVP